mmetsp:Transcript_21220/g.40394  ORF Transcript_21220/g.40394 Transcript_21220/m.40394 type:complete len:159 (-) Transcript_21220:172-648(-)|eukprot:CAMPEP_0114256050 /NCGR_PEP_ID=MMETSP0058-20121206/17921_1 /TAXON_ID=36894 /ORGANISM="Pyramimonas parkeae, CCMP726" /LENGTH=158 /DNA_ID=CAMNT_0001370541 /DNA_START=108 /DNA_END=584 /DNA_ORIENTATION=+
MSDARENAATLSASGLRELQTLLDAATGLLNCAHQATGAAIREARTAESRDPNELLPAVGGDAAKTNLKAEQLRYAQSRAALRRILVQCAKLNDNGETGKSMKKDGDAEADDAVERARLQARLAELREEAARKNKILKGLIDQMRELLSDLSMWKVAE